MNKILQRYFLKHFIAPFSVGFIFFVCFLLTFQLFKILRLAVRKNVEWTVILDLSLQVAVTFFPMAMPMACLFAMLYAFGKLSEDSEYVAMRSLGFSKNQIFFPFLLTGVLLASLLFILNSRVIPLGKKNFRNEYIRLGSKGMISEIKEGEFFTEIPSMTIFVEKTSKDKMLNGIFIHRSIQDGEQVIMAKRGTLKSNAQNLQSGQIPVPIFYLEEGNVFQRDIKKGNFQKTVFKTYEFPINNLSSLSSSYTTVSMRTNEGVIKEIKKVEKEYKLKKSSDLENSLAKLKMGLYMRYNSPFEVILFILVGFTFGIRNKRGSSRNSSLFGGLFLIGHYLFYYTCVSLTKNLYLSPAVAIILPMTISYGIAIYFYRRLDWAS